MKKLQTIFLLLILFISHASCYQQHDKFLKKPLEDESSSKIFTISLKRNEINSKQKHEIFDFISKSQSYLVSPQEKDMLLSTDHKVFTSSSLKSSIQKVSLYNFKNTQVKI